MPRDAVGDRRRQRSRSRSPRGEVIDRKKRQRQSPLPNKPLPFGARLLDKRDFTAYKTLFASYLDIQKQIYLEDIPEAEAKGRWKSFIRKWNHGELAEGWYDPVRVHKTIQQVPVETPSTGKGIKSVHQKPPSRSPGEEDDEDYGPAPPMSNNHSTRAGPSIPTMDDLALRRETEREDRESAKALAKASRRADAKLEKQRLEDLAPRAEAGTRERQLEKKREVAASNKAFAESKSGAAGFEMAEIGESDLMGGGDDDSIAAIRRRKTEEERKLSERELKREEFARARREEMEQRRNDFAQKEEERTKHFIELAKRRFG